MILKTIIVMTIAVVAVTMGDIFMSTGMKSVGELSITGVRSFFSTAWKILTTARIWCAIACMASFFFLWLSVLSWADLSLALPMTALTYVLNAVLAKPLLGETVSLQRWVGTLLVFVGVVVVVLSGGT